METCIFEFKVIVGNSIKPVEGFKSKKVNMEEVETSFGLHLLVPEEGIVMVGDKVMPEGVGLPGNIGALGIIGCRSRGLLLGEAAH